VKFRVLRESRFTNVETTTESARPQTMTLLDGPATSYKSTNVAWSIAQLVRVFLRLLEYQRYQGFCACRSSDPSSASRADTFQISVF